MVTGNGDSVAAEVSGASTRAFLLTLSITGVVEQEAIELSVLVSGDGATWEPKPIASLPQKFYAGEYPLLINLADKPDVRFLRAHWEVSRWGRGPTAPRFELGIRLREVPPELLGAPTGTETALSR